MDVILRTRNLTKRYKEHTAVRDVSMTLRRGDIYGFLGQNGAGKTTTLRMMLGLVQPTSGEIELFGNKVTAARQIPFERIGSIIEIPGFYPNISAVDNLDIHRRLMGMGNRDSIEESLDAVGLLAARNHPVKQFSLGMKQRLGLARALLHRPELLILDEPTTGLDPQGIRETRQLILDLALKRKITILLSSHILSEIEQMATQVGIIHRGRMLEEVPYEVLQEKNKQYLEIHVDNDRKAAMVLEQHLRIAAYQIIQLGVIRIYERIEEAAVINQQFVRFGLAVRELSLKRDSLEEYFMRLTGGRGDA